MEILLTSAEVRVLGALIEKEIATPDYYPLSLNALLNACNQSSNRDPVVAYDEATIAQALDGLKSKRLVLQTNVGRVPKYEETFLKSANLMPREAAALCVLMLRGPQTVGEIRTRSERLHAFATLEEAHETLQTLAGWHHVALLPRQAGRKEPRYAHLLCGPPACGEESAAVSPAHAPVATESETTTKLAADVEALRAEIEELKRAFFEFRAQFE